jgi:hypothetical protein
MRLLTLTLLLALTAPTQRAAWNLDGLHEVEQPIGRLNPPDRHAILRKLQIVAAQLRGEEQNATGGPTFFVQATGDEHCGATGNCDFWVLDSNHTILLKTTAQMATYLPQLHDGRRDVLTALHNSAFGQIAARWQFDGNRYRRTACADIANANSFTGKSYRQPRIKPTACTSY